MKLAFSLSLLVALQLCGTLHAQTSLLNGVAVIVNDKVITYKDVFNAIAEDEVFLVERYERQPQVLDQKRRELMESRIQELVEAQLILHEFTTAGYNLPESVIEDRINQDIRNYGDRLTLTKTLQSKGLTYEAYRQRIRERIIISEMWRHNVPPNPVISPHKIETYYLENQEKFQMGDQVKLRMIVLPSRPSEPSFSPRKLADEIMAKLDEGADFADMARVYSQGSQAAEGGDWGWIERTVLRPDLSEKAFALGSGERSGVIETPEGCYIMLVEEVKLAHLRPLGEIRADIEATLKAEEIKRLRARWIERLKTKSFVRYF
jgi:peptidyl-prolyl cis-trans isomerase SurA